MVAVQFDSIGDWKFCSLDIRCHFPWGWMSDSFDHSPQNFCFYYIALNALERNIFFVLFAKSHGEGHLMNDRYMWFLCWRRLSQTPALYYAPPVNRVWDALTLHLLLCGGCWCLSVLYLSINYCCRCRTSTRFWILFICRRRWRSICRSSWRWEGDASSTAASVFPWAGGRVFGEKLVLLGFLFRNYLLAWTR